MVISGQVFLCRMTQGSLLSSFVFFFQGFKFFSTMNILYLNDLKQKVTVCKREVLGVPDSPALSEATVMGFYFI